MDITHNVTMRGGRIANHKFSEEQQVSQIFSQNSQVPHHLKPGEVLPAYSVLEGNLYLKEQKPKVSAGKVFIFSKCFPVSGEWLVGISLVFVSLSVSDIIHTSNITTLGVRKFKYLPSWSS